MREVGNAQIKARRAERKVDCPPGGVVADYVPFYWIPRGPMFTRVVDRSTDGWAQRQQALIYFLSSPARLRDHGCRLVFTDRNAVFDLADMREDPNECPIDWELIDSRRYGWVIRQEDWTARIQAEVLAHIQVPLAGIERIAVIDDQIAERVRELLGGRASTIEVVVKRGWYY